MTARVQLLRSAYHLFRGALFRMNPELAHERMIALLGRLAASPKKAIESSPVTVAGIRFPNRIGLAAGLDKDGVAALAWSYFGFGFAELGTVTAKAQSGNPSPRLFRGIESRAIVNRMGFNNAGAHRLAGRLNGYGVRRGNLAAGLPLGISIGKTKRVDITDAIEDYLDSLNTVAPYADYVAVNVSSPNTPGLRSLQLANEIESLLVAICDSAHEHNNLPIFVKLAPDLEHHQLREIVAVLNSLPLGGIIATNTTLGREGLAASDEPLIKEPGGLSGAPLRERALRFVSELSDLTELPIIGVGGIMSPRDADRMFSAGAQLIQLYTGFIYEGPALIHGIHRWGR